MSKPGGISLYLSLLETIIRKKILIDSKCIFFIILGSAEHQASTNWVDGRGTDGYTTPPEDTLENSAFCDRIRRFFL